MRRTEIRIAGFGGQGVVLSATIIGKAACIYENHYATMTQSFGPEARGGGSSAQVILADEPILYPSVTRTDVLIVLSQEAYGLFVPELDRGGLLIVEEDLVRVSDLTCSVHAIPATRLAEGLGNRIVLNVVIVGFFAGVTGLLAPDALRRAVADSVPKSSRDLNLRAFEQGFAYAAEIEHRSLTVAAL